MESTRMSLSSIDPIPDDMVNIEELCDMLSESHSDQCAGMCVR